MHAERPAPILESPVEGAKLEQPRDASVAVVEQCVGSRGKGGYTLTGACQLRRVRKGSLIG